MEVNFTELSQARAAFSNFRNGWIIKRYTKKLDNSGGTVIEELNACLKNYDLMVGKINKLIYETDSYVSRASYNLEAADDKSKIKVNNS